MHISLTSDGTVKGTKLTDATGEPLQGIIAFNLSGSTEQTDLKYTVVFTRIPMQVNAMELKRAGGKPVGVVSYLCGCSRNYFASTDAMINGETCKFHGDAVLFHRVNVKPNLVNIEKAG